MIYSSLRRLFSKKGFMGSKKEETLYSPVWGGEEPLFSFRGELRYKKAYG